jgi:hypothetical protein
MQDINHRLLKDNASTLMIYKRWTTGLFSPGTPLLVYE